MKHVVITLGLTLSTFASAAEIKSGSYNAEKKAIELNVVYGGGCNEHAFSLQVGACLETFPVQCQSIKLVEDTKGDLCEALVARKVLIPLASAKLNDPYYAGASLTIHGDNNSQVSLSLPKAPVQKPLKQLICGLKNQKAKPYFTFIVSKLGDAGAAISYIKSAFYGSEEVQVQRPVSGCAAAEINVAEWKADSAYIECAGDGDAGYLNVERNANTKKVSGSMNFPNSGPEGLDSVDLPVNCTEVPLR